MGLFDRFRKKPGVSESATVVAEVDLQLPAAAKIESFVIDDGTGTLSLPDGRILRFGRPACRTFEPVPQAKVVIHSVSPHPLGGLKATELSIDDADRPEHARLLAERDARMGIRRERRPEPAEVNRRQAWITLLLEKDLPTAARGWRAWAEQLGLDARGIRVGGDAPLRFIVGGHEFLAHPGTKGYPRDKLDLRRLGGNFEVGRSFLGLSPMERPAIPLEEGELPPPPPDPWALDGSMRALSRLVSALLQFGTGVVLHRADGRVVEKASFWRRLGDIADPQNRPFGAWIELAPTEDQGTLRSYGMDVFGLPDVAASLENGAFWRKERAREAVLYACHRMVRAGRPFESQQRVRVPIGVLSGGGPLPPTPTEPASVEEYRVQADGGLVTLEAMTGRHDAADRWALASEEGADASPIALNGYQALFRDAFSRFRPSRLLYVLEPDAVEGNEAPFSIEVRQWLSGRGYLIVTNGVGRIAQPGGSGEKGTAHIELLAAVDDYDPEIASLLSRLGQAIHLHGGEGATWKPGDTLRLPEETLGWVGFLLDRGGELPFGRGAPVSLLSVIPLTEEEYGEVHELGASAWLSRNADEPAKVAMLRRG